MPESSLTRRQVLRRGAGVGGGLAALVAAGYAGYAWGGSDARVLNGKAAPPRVWSTTTRGVDADAIPFVSRPDLRPPTLTLSHEVGWTAPSALEGSYYILTPKAYVPDGPGQSGLMIVDADGELVWFRPTVASTLTRTDMQVQRYRGRPVLTWWEGEVPTGVGQGIGYVADQTYRVITTVQAGNGLKSDAHELNLTPSGTALITAYGTTEADLRAVKGPSKGTIYACQAQEIDVATGKMLFAWDSLEHVGIEESYAAYTPGATTPYDYFHINSVSLAEDGDLLISSRNTWTIYKVNRRTGEVVWRLGGKKSDFTFGPGVQFYWQHHVRSITKNRLTVFDDGASPAEESQSRGLILKIDESKMHCSLERAYTHPAKLLAANQGSVQVMPDGRVLVGWGDQPYFSEFTADGTMIIDARFPADDQTYRAFRAHWRGLPATTPDLVVKSFTTARTAFVSWNGDTRTAYWRVLGGKDSAHLSELIDVPKTGFETVIAIPTGGPYFAVEALDQYRRVLSRSSTVRPQASTSPSTLG
ncbi:MAG TPA: arylsulfotransferase family protein [Acidimicrobiales bacterium]|nr:arylsulfotransferase family protein [Acidimicrobiales bacterium]